MYRDNTPNFNSGNRRLVNFKGFNPEEEEKELRDIQKSQIKKNGPDTQSQEHRRKNRWNKATHKIEDLHPSEVDDKLEEFEELKEYLDPMGDWSNSENKVNNYDELELHFDKLSDFLQNNKQEILDYCRECPEDGLFKNLEALFWEKYEL